MEDDSETPVGVKMLADHLVKVKIQYEGTVAFSVKQILERINNLLVHVKTIEKEKEDMKRRYKLMEDELEQRRIEIYQLKRESDSQYVMEERENWKAILVQQKKVNSKLERGLEWDYPAYSLDLEISNDRIKSLEAQLEKTNNDQIVEKEDMKKTEELVHSAVTATNLEPPQSVQEDEHKEEADSSVIEESTNECQSIQDGEKSEENPPTIPSALGPPQPAFPPDMESEEQPQELIKANQTIAALSSQLQEAKQLNL